MAKTAGQKLYESSSVFVQIMCDQAGRTDPSRIHGKPLLTLIVRHQTSCARFRTVSSEITCRSGERIDPTGAVCRTFRAYLDGARLQR